MSKTLWEINEQIDMLTDQLVDDETGEINEEVMEQLEQLSIDRNEKIESCGIVMKQLASEVDAINAEIKRKREEFDLPTVDVGQEPPMKTQN